MEGFDKTHLRFVDYGTVMKTDNLKIMASFFVYENQDCYIEPKIAIYSQKYIEN